MGRGAEGVRFGEGVSPFPNRGGAWERAGRGSGEGAVPPPQKNF